MPITANTLYRDTMNFTRNQFISILMMSLLTAFITVILNHALSPSVDELRILSSSGSDLSSSVESGLMDLIQQMTPEQQTVLLKMSAAGTFAALVGNVLLTGGVLMLIQLVSDGHRTSALRAIGASTPFLLRLLFLILLCTLLIQLGMMLLVIPGVLLAIALSLSPVIVVTEKSGIFSAIKASTKLAYGNLRVTAPAIVMWLLAKIAILLVVSKLPISSPTVLGVVLNGLSNLISAILLIYLFRLYMLLRA
ncbi:YciC family protein [Pectobacterium aroidearum]|uniref:YciC family protein n=1 Tax=Pectobacterium aroidearum TaxID=1201031 RepID=UPI00330792AA